MSLLRVGKLAVLAALLVGASPNESEAALANARVSVDFGSSQGSRLRAERMNNLSRARTFPEQRDADVQFYNEKGLHGEIYRVWVDAQLIHDAEKGSYSYDGISDYLADASRLSDQLLMVMDTRVLIRDQKQTPAQIKPVIKAIMGELKRRFPAIRYIEVFNEPDHNLVQVVKPEGLYDYYRVYYEAVNEINRELEPQVPLEVGGPAFMMYNEAWLRAFLDSYKADPSPGKRLDFISGDELKIDNSNFLALQTYHRHQVPTSEFKAWDQFRGPDGKPLYPQRPTLLGPLFVKATSGSLQTGKFDGKMIVVASLWDREAFPWQADWYRSRVQAHLGDKADDHFRLWYTDHALHGDEPTLEDPTRIVSYEGVLQQALRDLSAWVEKGVTPASSTQYRIDEAQVIVPPTAAERGGIQPVVTLTANRGVRAVATGEEVTFTGTIAVPRGTGSVVAAEWDFDGSGAFAVSSPVPKDARSLNVSIKHRFDQPGTYFPVLRGVSQRKGDVTSPYARIANLGRVRVVVK